MALVLQLQILFLKNIDQAIKYKSSITLKILKNKKLQSVEGAADFSHFLSRERASSFNYWIDLYF